MSDGRILRDTGMALAIDAEDQSNPGWSESALDAIRCIAFYQATVHVDDVLRMFHEKPHHPNAWGQVWLKAIRAGIIERTGTVRPCVSDPNKHNHNYPVYRSLTFRNA